MELDKEPVIGSPRSDDDEDHEGDPKRMRDKFKRERGDSDEPRDDKDDHHHLKVVREDEVEEDTHESHTGGGGIGDKDSDGSSESSTRGGGKKRGREKEHRKEERRDEFGRLLREGRERDGSRERDRDRSERHQQQQQHQQQGRKHSRGSRHSPDRIERRPPPPPPLPLPLPPPPPPPSSSSSSSHARERDSHRERERDRDRERERDREKGGHSPPPYKRGRREDPADAVREWPEYHHGFFGRDGSRERGALYPGPMGGAYRGPFLDDRGPRVLPPPPALEALFFPPAAAGALANRINTFRNAANRQTKVVRPQIDFYEGPQKTYKQFLETQDDYITPQDAERKFEEYKAEYKKRQARGFFKDHKLEEWFKEKYEPSYLEKKAKDREELSKANLKLFAIKLSDGAASFSLDADAHLEEGEQMEDDESVAEEVEEIPEEGALEESELDKEDKPETAVAPPDTMEISAPKTGADEPDKEKGSEEKKIISLKPANPRKGERIDLPLESSPQPTTATVVQQNQPQKTKTMEPPNDPNTLFIKSVPPNWSRPELLEIFNKVGGGSHVCKMVLSEPNRLKNFYRIGWVTYKNQELCSLALRELNNYKLKDYEVQLSPHKGSGAAQQRRVKLTPEIAAHETRLTQDLQQSQSLMLLLDKEKSIEDNILLANDDWPSFAIAEKLDQIIHYLRMVHFFCYYCAEEFEDDWELQRKCGGAHLRRRVKKKSSPTGATADDENGDSSPAHAWVISLDAKIKARLQKPDNPSVYTGKDISNQALDSFYQEQIKRLEEEKYRCMVCNKLFKGDEFVRKHIIGKHSDNLSEVKQKALEEQFFLNYVSDPKRMSPFVPILHHVQLPRSTPPPNRRFPVVGAPPPQWSEFSEPNPFRPQRDFLLFPGEGRGIGRGAILRGGRGGISRGRGGIGDLSKRDNRFKPYPMRSPSQPLPPPLPFHDPRGIREYVDLDAPAEDVPQIDYRTALKEYADKQKEK